MKNNKRRGRWIRRSLSLLLVFVMCLGMMNVTAFAEDGGNNAETEKAV